MTQFVTRLMAALALFAIATSAVAQGTRVLVIDQQRVIIQSEVGKYIASQLETIANQMKAEVDAQAAPLKTESDALKAQTATLTPEALQARPDLVQRINTLAQNANNFQRTRQIKARELVATEGQALEPVYVQVETILNEMMAEKSADILLDRSQVYFVSQTTDITQEVINRLNARMTTTPVTRVRMPTQPQGN